MFFIRGLCEVIPLGPQIGSSRDPYRGADRVPWETQLGNCSRAHRVPEWVPKYDDSGHAHDP
jgi:hypothetical protein